MKELSPKVALAVSLAICAVSFFIPGCGSGVGQADPCAAASIPPEEVEASMDLILESRYDFGLSYEQEMVIWSKTCDFYSSCPNGHCATSPEACFACAKSLVDIVYTEE